MRTITFGNPDPIKYLEQSAVDYGVKLVVDESWIKDPDINYETTVSVSDDSTDEQAVDELLRIWSIHGRGVPSFIKGNDRKIMEALALHFSKEE